ncbi:hypothetical protein BDW75DRAFT_216005 [Aspergillus navahoensis]
MLKATKPPGADYISLHFCLSIFFVLLWNSRALTETRSNLCLLPHTHTHALVNDNRT